jgi:hypothetical protein
VLLATGRDWPRRSCARLASLLTRPARRAGDPLWHDKDLYHPVLIVRAAVVAARQLAQDAGVAGSSAAVPVTPDDAAMISAA